MTKEISYYESSRNELIKLIPDDAKHILDVGCGVGNLGAAIKDKRGRHIEVVGIEKEPIVEKKAKDNLDLIIIGDAENISLPFEKEYFDCIIYGDVLEHLINPWGLLARHCEYLKPKGLIIASIPNIAHYRIIKMLKKNEWNYKDAGVLDDTHLRFFTIKSVKKMFSDAHLEIIKVNYNISASKIKKFLNKIFFNFLIDHIAEQYLIVAQKKPVKYISK